MNNGLNTGTTPNGTSDAQRLFGNIPQDPEGTQAPNIAPTAAAKDGLSSTNAAGGGGGGLGGGGTPGADGSGRAGGTGAAAGWDANILRGISSGNGYSVSGGGLKSGAGGGFSGYGAASGKDALGKPFNLKDFLPGGKNSALRTTAFRGLASNIADISPAHTDLFQKVSDRFHAVCMRDALYDCATLQKMKKPLN
jgi:hypothetical protein